MAVPPARCDDWTHDITLRPGNPAANVTPHPPCTNARGGCTIRIPEHVFPKPYDVCNTTEAQATMMLALRRGPAWSAPANLGPPLNANVNTANYRKMEELGPPNLAGPAWQTPGEIATGIAIGPTPNLRFDGWLTRLCTSCEQFEQSEARYRFEATIAIPPGGVPHPLWLEEYEVTENEIPIIEKWDNYPYSTCTCKHAVGARQRDGVSISGQYVNEIAGLTDYGVHSATWAPPRMCLDHRRRAFNALQQKRDRNDHWLQNVESTFPNSPDSTVVKKATAQTKRNRVQGAGYWRACRVSGFHQCLMCT